MHWSTTNSFLTNLTLCIILGVDAMRLDAPVLGNTVSIRVVVCESLKWRLT